MPNADTISNTPMTMSQIPTTSARVMIDSNGEAITTMPASRLINADENLPAAAGQVRIADGRNGCRDAAEDEADADPDGQQQHGVTEMPERQHGQDQRRRAADEQQDAAARRQHAARTRTRPAWRR